MAYGPQQAVAPGSNFTSTLPCLPTEKKVQGCVAGQIIVRSPDGTHFCPTEMVFPNPCPVYSSGEKRWGAATVLAADQAF